MAKSTERLAAENRALAALRMAQREQQVYRAKDARERYVSSGLMKHHLELENQRLRAELYHMREVIPRLETQIKSMELQADYHALQETEAREEGNEEAIVSLDTLKGKAVLFTIMPFEEKFNDVWVGAIKKASAGTNLTPIRVDMITESSDISSDIVSLIASCRIVIVDLTGSNANVMFEAGYSLAMKKDYVFITQSPIDEIPFDIKTIRTITYKNTWQGIEGLRKELEKFIKTALSDKKKKTQ